MLADLAYLIYINVIDYLPALIAYGLPLALAWHLFLRSKKKANKSNIKQMEESRKAGLLEPTSLHPIIDYNICLGCGTCVRACPEGEVLGIINEKAHLINPSNCIGHGACKSACPVNAISLVLGSEKRGVDIPTLDSDFQTNMPGIYVAGELGGMGLIRNAVSQGTQAINAIKNSISHLGQAPLDVVIIGAGPAGFAASLAAMEQGLSYYTLEQDTLGGTVAHYPRGKIVMTGHVTLPLVGKIAIRETTKERLINFWQSVAQQTGVKINYQEQMTGIETYQGGYLITTDKNRYHTKAVLLAIGRRGTPRKLNVPGEEQSKVVYRLIDPSQYQEKHVLVVGGGDSALEAAASIAEEFGTFVTLAYRGDAFQRAKPKNRVRIEAAQQSGKLNVLFNTVATEISASEVTLSTKGERPQKIPNDAVIVCTGGILPTPLLKKIGIAIETKRGHLETA